MKNQMKIVTISIILLLGFGLFCIEQPAWMNGSDEDMPTLFIQSEDADGDGRVSRDEFKGPDNEFEQLDSNSDGYIELSEAPTPSTMPDGMGKEPPMQQQVYREVIINGVTFNIPYELFTWDNLPQDVPYQRQPIH